MKKGNKIKYTNKQKVTQKNTLRLIIVGSSILSMVALVCIYINFSSTENSIAAEKENSFTPTLRTTDISVPKKLIRKNDELNPENNAADIVSHRKLVSRQSDFIEVTSTLNVNNSAQ